MQRLLFFVFICYSVGVSAQNFESLQEVKLSSPAEYKEYQEQVADCCYYILQTPEDKKDEERKYAIQFAKRWLKGSPDCSYKISDSIKQLTEEKEVLMNLFVVSYTLVYIEHLRDASDNNGNDLEGKAVAKFLNYCNEGMNKIKLTKEMKKLISEGSYEGV